RDGFSETIFEKLKTNIRNESSSLISIVSFEIDDVAHDANDAPNIVVNLSTNKELSNAEISLLNKGLTFCPNNKKPTKYRTLVDITNLERKLMLKQFFHKENSEVDEFNLAPNESTRTRSIKDICNKESNFIPGIKETNISNFIKNTRKCALEE